MLKAFPAAYAATIPSDGGPELTVEAAANVVLSKGGIAAYEAILKTTRRCFRRTATISSLIANPQRICGRYLIWTTGGSKRACPPAFSR
jgi:hypothetical protein